MASDWRDWLSTPDPQGPTQALIGRWFRTVQAILRHRSAMTGLAIISLITISVALAPLLFDADAAFRQMLADRLAPPSPQHWLGTDELGRDILARIALGGRVTLTIVIVVCALILPVGLAFGMAAGYLGGTWDAVLMRVTDVFLAFPRLVLALAFCAALGPGVENAIVAIAITAWPPYARLARAEAMLVRKAEFIEASILQGASAPRVILTQILPMCLPSTLIRLTLDMSGIILTAASLGFLGLGAQPPTPEWGAMVSTGRNVLYEQWWVATLPGIAIMVISLGFNLLGDGLRDIFDAR